MAIELQHPIALMMIDIDHFKLFNDHYGHLEGDFCLRRVGKVLSAAIRKDTDLAVRYGGEEFVLLLPVTDVAEALDVAERLRRAVEELRIAHEPAPVRPCHDQHRRRGAGPCRRRSRGAPHRGRRRGALRRQAPRP
jgi:diguanylate cyclase (GGDEF)-like protein